MDQYKTTLWLPHCSRPIPTTWHNLRLSFSGWGKSSYEWFHVSFCLKPESPFSSPPESPTTSPEKNTQPNIVLADPSPKNESNMHRKLTVQTFPHNKLGPKLSLLPFQLKNPTFQSHKTPKITSGKQGHDLGMVSCVHREAVRRSPGRSSQRRVWPGQRTILSFLAGPASSTASHGNTL